MSLSSVNSPESNVMIDSDSTEPLANNNTTTTPSSRYLIRDNYFEEEETRHLLSSSSLSSRGNADRQGRTEESDTNAPQIISHWNKVKRLVVKLYSGHLFFFLFFHRAHQKNRKTNYLFQSALLDDGEFVELLFVQKLVILMAFVAVTVVNCYFTFLLIWTRRNHCHLAFEALLSCELTYASHSHSTNHTFCQQNRYAVYDSSRGYYPRGAVFHYQDPVNYNFSSIEDEVRFTQTSQFYVCFSYCSAHRWNHEDRNKERHKCHLKELKDLWCAFPNHFIYKGCNNTLLTNYAVTFAMIFVGLIIFYPAKLISRVIIGCTTGRGHYANKIGRMASYIVYIVLAAYVVAISALYVVLIGMDLIPYISPKKQVLQMLWRLPLALFGNFFFDWLIIHCVFIWKSIVLRDSIFKAPQPSIDGVN